MDVGFTIAKTIPAAVQENELGVTGVERAFDSQNNVVAYVVKGTTTGYNAEAPIEMATTITADGKVVCGIDIIKQEETEYLGVRIATDDFKNNSPIKSFLYPHQILSKKVPKLMLSQKAQFLHRLLLTVLTMPQSM